LFRTGVSASNKSWTKVGLGFPFSRASRKLLGKSASQDGVLFSVSEVEVILSRVSKQHVKEFAWLVASQLSILVIGFVSIKITAHMGPVEYGKFALSMSAVTFTSLLLYTPLDQSIGRYYYEYKAAGLGSAYLRFLKKSLAIVSTGTVLLTVIVSTILYCIGYGSHFIWYLIVTGLMASATSTSGVLKSVINIARFRTAFAVIAALERLLRLLALVALIQLFTISAENVVGLYFLVALLTVFVEVLYLNGKISSGLGRGNNSQEKQAMARLLNDVIDFGKPVLVLGILGWVQTNGERWVIQSLMDTRDVGIYAFMSVIANTMLVMLITAATQFTSPIIYEKFSDMKNLTKIRQGLSYIKLFALAVGILTSFFVIVAFVGRQWIILLLGSKGFLSNALLLPVIFLSVGIYNMAQTFCSVGFLLKRNMSYIVPNMVSGISMLALYVVGIHFLGLAGVAWGSVISSVIYLLLVLRTNAIIRRDLVID